MTIKAQCPACAGQGEDHEGDHTMTEPEQSYSCTCRPGWDGSGVYHDLDCPAFLRPSRAEQSYNSDDLRARRIALEQQSDSVNRADVRDTLAALAFIWGSLLPEALYAVLAEPTDSRLDALIELIELRRSSSS